MISLWYHLFSAILQSYKRKNFSNLLTCFSTLRFIFRHENYFYAIDVESGTCMRSSPWLLKLHSLQPSRLLHWVMTMIPCSKCTFRKSQSSIGIFFFFSRKSVFGKKLFCKIYHRCEVRRSIDHSILNVYFLLLCLTVYMIYYVLYDGIGII